MKQTFQKPGYHGAQFRALPCCKCPLLLSCCNESGINCATCDYVKEWLQWLIFILNFTPRIDEWGLAGSRRGGRREWDRWGGVMAASTLGSERNRAPLLAGGFESRTAAAAVAVATAKGLTARITPHVVTAFGPELPRGRGWRAESAAGKEPGTAEERDL